MAVYILWRSYVFDYDFAASEMVGIYSTPELAEYAISEDLEEQERNGYHLADWTYYAERATLDNKRTFFPENQD